MIDWRDELRELLAEHRLPPGPRSAPTHNKMTGAEIDALVKDLEPFIEERFAPIGELAGAESKVRYPDSQEEVVDGD